MWFLTGCCGRNNYYDELVKEVELGFTIYSEVNLASCYFMCFYSSCMAMYCSETKYH